MLIKLFHTTRTTTSIVAIVAMLLFTSDGFAQSKKKNTDKNREAKPASATSASGLENDNKRVDSLKQALPYYASLRVLAKSSKDSVVLRWAPTKSGPWKAYNSIGYVVERMNIDEGNTFEKLTPSPLKPWSIDEWKARSRPEQQFSAIAVQCLYGRLSVPNATSSLNALVDASQEFENKYGFALLAADNDAHTANGLALRFVDKTAKEGKTYLYRISTARKDSIFIIDTGYVAVTVGASEPLPPISTLKADEREGKVMLQWKNPLMFYSGFHVYKKSGGKIEQLTKTPLVAMTPSYAKETQDPYYEDTTAGYYTNNTYIVRGVDPFGDYSEPAEIMAMGKDKTPPPIPSVNKPLVFGKAVSLTWEVKNPVPDLRGFIIERSDSLYGNFKPITTKLLDKDARAYLDTLVNPDEPFYNIIAIDTAGNLSENFPIYAEIIDTLPPSVPKYISGTIDTNGIVKLLWNLGKERDLLGYRVLWANDSTHEFTQRTNLVLQDTVFYDSIAVKTLTKDIYYKLVAVDTRYFHSEATPIIRLRRPDVLPPEAPLFTDVFVTDSSVVLRWAHSRSDDVKEQLLYKRKQGEKEWKVFKKFESTLEEFKDTSVVKRSVYEYQLQAVDSSNLKSPLSTPVTGRPYDTGYRPPIENLRLEYNEKTGKLEVRWTYVGIRNEKYWFVVYRGLEDYPLKQLFAVDAKDRSWTDGTLVGKGRYRYAIRVMSPLGESPMSEIKEILIK